MVKEEHLADHNGPATYQITVDGSVDDAFIKALNGMSVIHNQVKDKTLSTLTGELRDQSALNGILNTLYDYQFSVISVLKL